MRAIVRVEHDKNRPYLSVSVDTVRDKSVSFELRGFLMFLLAKPDEWRVRPEELARECGLHFTSIYRMLRGLIKAGYVKREVLVRRTKDGRFDSGSMYVVYEKKQDQIPF